MISYVVDYNTVILVSIFLDYLWLIYPLMPEGKNQNGLRERVSFGLLQVVRLNRWRTPVKCKSRGICLRLTAIFFDQNWQFCYWSNRKQLIYSNHLLAFPDTVQLYAHAGWTSTSCHTRLNIQDCFLTFGNNYYNWIVLGISNYK